MKTQKKYTYDQVAFILMFISIIMLFLASTANFSKQVDGLNQQIEDQEQHYECEIDSLLNTIDKIKITLDSIPIGPPLDTIILQDDYGVRKHPIIGLWQMHSGVDLIDTWHDTVYATASGVVRFASWNYGYGRCIEIEHAFEFTTKYAHLHRLFVKRGDSIIKGQAIACMGATGDVTGQHLHYEITHDGKPIDPLPYINCSPISVKATMYHPVKAQCDDNPLETADGSIIDPYNVSSWNWIAVSQDMLKKNGGIFNYGDKVYISGTHKDGLYTIHDCMNRRKTSQIDFLENIGTKQYRYNNIELYAIND